MKFKKIKEFFEYIFGKTQKKRWRNLIFFIMLLLAGSILIFKFHCELKTDWGNVGLDKIETKVNINK